MTVSARRTGLLRDTVAVLPEMTVVLVPSMARAAPSDGAALTRNALPAGAESMSRFSLKVTFSMVPVTVALAKVGAVVSASGMMPVASA